MPTASPKTPGWLDWHPNPSRPAFRLPPGTVDTHCHVFGPQAAFPFAPQRKYTPCDAGKDRLFALRDHLGVARTVVVQATCHGTDNSAMVDAVRSAGDRARGVASVRPDVTEGELLELHAAGVRGVRFNFVRRLVDASPQGDLRVIADKVAPLGWHVVLYFESADLPDLEDFFASLPTPLVVDHMGRPDVTRPADGPEFSRFLRFVDTGDVWVKVTCPERLSVTGPAALDGAPLPYADVVPFGRRVVEEFPDRVLWGTDWPHPNLTDHMPDDGLLVDYVPRVAVTAEQRRKLLVDNPMNLYWPGEEI
ncbi:MULTISPECIES: amidohydrolase family protein [unclassified Streptomyces]|uniref:amidohydrolase family protein n=1 Tax=unclassified Streptomyces TaxID=2593676 RepID=UPI000939788B|nr:amidohydrolase family protein [Streptomyces sp. CB02400]OKK07402.1 2-pyrone-4,6-dicarboxylate hydrolase [Streptomyces sp. CB02400]